MIIISGEISIKVERLTFITVDITGNGSYNSARIILSDAEAKELIKQLNEKLK
jgi:hypothetical protein